MNDKSYENSIFEVLNVELNGKVVLNFLKFKFKFVVKQALDKAQMLMDSLMQEYFG